ncbi:MAG: hypothetical protein PUE61_04950 [Clostridiales bacterium]|nr:hypothetical protein [Clostridiales bacterium]
MILHLINDVNRALEHDCFFAALALALTLPDACGKAEYPNDGVSTRYKEWCKKYVCPHEMPSSPYGDDMPYLSEEILYKLRCSLLHQSTPNVNGSEISEERCKVDTFSLIITNADSVNGGLTRVAYGAGMRIVEREQSVSIRHICFILCKAAKVYYEANQGKFSFINYNLIDERNEE